MSLSGVVVDKVVTNPPYIVVREPWSSEIRLIVLLDAPMALQRWQTVDVTLDSLRPCVGPFVPENSESEALASTRRAPKRAEGRKNAGGYIPIIQEAEVSDQTPYPVNNFTLTPRLSGAVKRWNTQHTELLAVPGAVVWVEPSGGGAVLASTTTDCEGNFALPVAGGSYRALAEHPSYAGRPWREVDVGSSAACIAFTVSAGGGAVPCSQ